MARLFCVLVLLGVVASYFGLSVFCVGGRLYVEAERTSHAEVEKAVHEDSEQGQ